MTAVDVELEKKNARMQHCVAHNDYVTDLCTPAKPQVKVTVCHGAAKPNTTPVPVTPVTKTPQVNLYLCLTLIAIKHKECAAYNECSQRGRQ
jgi:hypothetical protein